MARRTVKQTQIVQFFAGRLRDLRQSRGMTQRELADRANITLTYISKLEAAGAAPGIDLLERLASALDTEVAAFLPAIQQSNPTIAELKRLFDSALRNAGNETLIMLQMLLVRLADSPATKR